MFSIAAIVTGCLAFLTAAAGGKAAITLGMRLGLADRPGGRRTHPRVTSRLGGIPILAGFLAGLAAAQTLGPPTSDPNEHTRLLGLVGGSLFMFVLGALDDRFQLAPLPQFVGQAIAGGFAIGALIFIERFRNPLSGLETVLPYWLTFIISMVWFMGTINTVNWLDGVDGLAGTIAVIASVFTALHMWREGQLSVALLPLGLCGALSGFLLFNLPPARLFMGGGAPMLGFILACLGIIAGAKLALFLLVMGVPIADVAWQILDRVRRGQNPTQGDRGHLHFRLQDAGWSARKIVATYGTVCVAFGVIALLPLQPGAKLAVLLALYLAVAFALVRLSRAHAPNR